MPVTEEKNTGTELFQGSGDERGLPEKAGRNAYTSIIYSGASSALTSIGRDAFQIDGKVIPMKPHSPEKAVFIIKRGYGFMIPLEALSETSIRLSVLQLFDALMQRYSQYGCISTENGDYTVIMKLEEFMRMRSLKDRKTAREQVESDISVLLSLRVSNPIEDDKGEFQNVNEYINIGAYGVANSIIEFSFTKAFLSLVTRKFKPMMMPYPQGLYQIDQRRNPHSYYFGKKIAEHKNMNHGKGNENIISVRNLLKSSPYMPSETYVKDHGSKYEEKLLIPLQRDLEALEAVLPFTWEFCNPHEKPLTDDQLERFNWQTIKNLYIYVFWENYPERTKQGEKKEPVFPHFRKKFKKRKSPKKK